ncbi:MAG: helix-turn-helix domain-containing protein [Oscillospiraceae bacterium]
MNLQIKDKFYDEFIKEPTKENFRKFLDKNCGELDEIDFKQEWIDKGALSKIILAMANSRGGIIVIGVKENDDGTLDPVGIEDLKDKADINNSILKYVPRSLDYEIFDFPYETSEYEKVQNKKFQMIFVHDTPERLPFISLGETTGLEKDTIYVRRGTKSVKASSEEIEKILEAKIATIFKESSDMSLQEHLEQLKLLYNELPKKISVLVKKGEPSPIFETLASLSNKMTIWAGTPDEYEERDNPNYPEESYEAFVLNMIKLKKQKIERVLDLK